MSTTATTTEIVQDKTALRVPGLGCGPYGQRLCVQVADELAHETPDRIYATVTNSPSDINHGFRDITIKEFVNAVNYAAWDIELRFGKCDAGKFDVIAYIGNSDVRYAVYLYAAIKTGYQIMIPSVRNSSSQHLSVFVAAECDRLLYTPNFESTVSSLKSMRPGLKSYSVPELDVLLRTPSKHYEYNKTWAEARTDPIIVAHSSGSTGNPKPTTITNGVYSTYDNHRKIPKIPGRKIQGYTLLDLDGGKFYNPFPPFHLAGLFAMTIMPIFYDCTVTLGPPEKPPSGELLSQAMKMLKIKAGWCPPTVIEQLLEQPGGFEQAASLDWIMYTGGPLAQAVGDKLCTVTDVCQMYGSTETGPHITLVPLSENWQWFEWHPLLENKMEDQGDGTYEMVVYKDPSLDWVRHLSQAYPHLEVWHTNDLFVRHPEAPHLWKFAGRKDDVLVLSNGEKFNPVNMEGAIVGHPLVRGALIVGTGRFQASLIVEPKPGLDMSKDAFIDSIWPAVEKGNSLGPAHGRIFRHKVVVATEDKPFKRAGKGTVIRGQTTKLYSDEVDAVYEEETIKVEQLSSAEDVEEITKIVRSCVSRMMPDSITDADNLFVFGMDSLRTLELTKALNRAFTTQLQSLGQGNISTGISYTHPTIKGLSQHLHRAFNGLTPLVALKTSDRSTRMEDLIEKYSSNLDPRESLAVPPSDNGLQVALTGSTGSLGTHILRTLLDDPKISRIYCLDRAKDARARHMSALQSTGLNKIHALHAKAVFLNTNFDDATFGLSKDTYEDLRQNLDAVIHNAWKVDFNHNLSSFESTHIRGIRHLVDFSITSARHTHIFFVSSLSSVGNWPTINGSGTPVPEAAMTDSNVAMEMGYGESKHVAEGILHNAVEKAGISATILRAGQLAGPLAKDGGVWNRNEWFPSLMKSSKALGLLPDAMNTIDWIPVDSMARIITELVHSERTSQSSQVFNLANPTTSEWIWLVSSIFEAWGPSNTEIVPFDKWLTALNAETDLEKFPALRIADFYVGFAQEAYKSKNERISYDVQKAAKHSKTMAELKPVNREALATWLRQWAF